MQDQITVLRVLAWGERQAWWNDHRLQVLTPGDDAESSHYDAALFAPAAPSDLDSQALRARLQQLSLEVAVLVVAPGLAESLALSLLKLGVQDVVETVEPAGVLRAIRFAVERRRQQHAARLAYATDLSTGLPHQEQLLEYVSQLIALRAREPAALVLIVLRIEESARPSGPLGPEASRVLRRKLAVRLRAALRASDVVASLDPTMFGVLLGHLESVSDGQTVVAKLQESLRQPVSVAGQLHAVAVAAGLAQWPDHGQDPQLLLQRAKAQASSAVAMGRREGYGRAVSGRTGIAANDEAPGT